MINVLVLLVLRVGWLVGGSYNKRVRRAENRIRSHQLAGMPYSLCKKSCLVVPLPPTGKKNVPPLRKIEQRRIRDESQRRCANRAERF